MEELCSNEQLQFTNIGSIGTRKKEFKFMLREVNSCCYYECLVVLLGDGIVW